MGILVQQLHERIPVDDAGLREVTQLAAGLDPYVAHHTTPEPAALRAVAQRTAEHDWASGRAERSAAGHAPLEQEMLSGHVEGQFLKMLAHALRAHRVLEIGMFTGYSALALAEALPADGVVIACEIDPGVAAFAREGFAESPHGGLIDVRVGPALATLAELAGTEPFDLVFLDADKSGYLAYLDAVLDGGLLAPHGLLCVDNTLLQGQPWTDGPATPNGAAIAAFNDAVSADPRIEQVLLPLRDGMTLIRHAGAR